jgi:aldose 1-epimerase
MLTKRSVATTAEGDDIFSITLTQGDFTAEILSLGAILKTLKTPDRNGEIRDIVLGFDNPLDNLAFHHLFRAGGWAICQQNREGPIHA